ncbi:TM1812 family CRISPR-associated protein [Allorhodopirellula heiligendammensis]|uniref:CRISPR-associated (Cas) DxTHG family protein n=1 Tax=Allorhodopirellula heiligendammensis TaxID=2714739 RepID=A0A5C6C046_9BACT|nr:TM1812 family CRISPR-associated protein [Allorhodopirellula heiligendammensis]TWU17950.1 CRISPR-associated (Cas) DxTHG family protein [Allorhodopirellula heiligendammensis]
MSDVATDRHILLSSVGVLRSPERSAITYSRGNVEADAKFSFHGLWKLLPVEEQPSELAILATPQARESSWKEIQEESAKLDLKTRCIDLVGDADDTNAFLETAAANIPEGCDLTLNVTEGLRHHAFLFYALVLYLTTFRRVRIRGVWYCRMETENRDDSKPIIDLTPVLELAHWFHALAVFRETGSMRQIAGLVADRGIQRQLNELSQFFMNGLPVETGLTATRLLAIDRPVLPSHLPLRSEIERELKDEIQPLAAALPENQSINKVMKGDVVLTRTELERQATCIDRYLRTGQDNLGFGLMREWLVSWLAFQDNAGGGWLKKESRGKYEQALRGLDIVHRGRAPWPEVRALLSDAQQEWAQRWNRVTSARNALQHHGMDAQEFKPDSKGMRKAKEDWWERENWASLPPSGGGHGPLLIAPIGNTPGVLFSAIVHTRPARVLAVCSEDTASATAEAVSKASEATGDPPVEVMRLTMTNPHTGVDEFTDLLRQASLWLYSADEVRASLTGGTSLMGVLVSRLSRLASNELQRPVHEFLLIDHRPPQQQRNEPWQLGEIHYFNGEPSVELSKGDAESDVER